MRRCKVHLLGRYFFVWLVFFIFLSLFCLQKAFLLIVDFALFVVYFMFCGGWGWRRLLFCLGSWLLVVVVPFIDVAKTNGFLLVFLLLNILIHYKLLSFIRYNTVYTTSTVSYLCYVSYSMLMQFLHQVSYCLYHTHNFISLLCILFDAYAILTPGIILFRSHPQFHISVMYLILWLCNTYLLYVSNSILMQCRKLLWVLSAESRSTSTIR